MLQSDEVTVVIICEWQQWLVSVSDGSGPGGRDKPLFDINIDWTVCLEQIVNIAHSKINGTTFTLGMHVTNLFVTVADT